MKSLIVITTLIMSQNLWADRDDDDYPHHLDVAYAKVISAEPVVRIVHRSEPQTFCEPVTVEVHRERSNTGGKLVGAVIGGAIGHAIGHRHHHAGAGTVVGAIAGAQIGGMTGRRSDSVEYRTENRCRTEHISRQESILDGYNVRYRYQGRTYHTFTPEHPGKRIRVNVNVSPAWDD